MSLSKNHGPGVLTNMSGGQFLRTCVDEADTQEARMLLLVRDQTLLTQLRQGQQGPWDLIINPVHNYIQREGALSSAQSGQAGQQSLDNENLQVFLMSACEALGRKNGLQVLHKSGSVFVPAATPQDIGKLLELRNLVSITRHDLFEKKALG